MATVELADVATRVTPEIAKQLQLAMREAVNKAALAITNDARERVKLAIGPEQRLSGSRITKSWTVEHPGTEGSQRIYTPPVAGGRRINPAYKQADSVTNPTAVIGARGPAQWIEHNRKGGYDIRPRRRAASASSRAALDTMLADVFGPDGGRRSTKRLGHAGALPIGPGVYRAAAEGGPITRPQGGPITMAVRRAPATVRGLVEQHLAERLDRTMGSF